MILLIFLGTFFGGWIIRDFSVFIYEAIEEHFDKERGKQWIEAKN